MRKMVLSVAAAGLIAAGAGVATAGDVNCGLVNKDLAMGRTPEDISERMMISVDDVKKCQAEAKAGAAGAKAAGQEKAAGAAGTHTGDAGTAPKPDGHAGH